MKERPCDGVKQCRSSKANLDDFIGEFKTTLKFMTNPHQLLLAPICFHAGFSIAFTNGEVTRAFVSCIFGVKQVRRIKSKGLFSGQTAVKLHVNRPYYHEF